MPWAAKRSRSASRPATAKVIRPARPRSVGLDEERGVLVDVPEDFFPSAHVRGSPEAPRVPIDRGAELGYRDAGDEVSDRALHASPRRPRGPAPYRIRRRPSARRAVPAALARPPLLGAMNAHCGMSVAETGTLSR